MNNNPGFFQLRFRQQEFTLDDRSYNMWKSRERDPNLPCPQVDYPALRYLEHHPFSGAVERLEAMIPRMSTVIAPARQKGAAINHAPSDTMDYYANSPHVNKSSPSYQSICPQPQTRRPSVAL